jgi:hypothetical protein
MSDKKWFNHGKLWLMTWVICEIIIGVGSYYINDKPEGRWAYFISFSVVGSFLLFLNWMYDRGEE